MTAAANVRDQSVLDAVDAWHALQSGEVSELMAAMDRRQRRVLRHLAGLYLAADIAPSADAYAEIERVEAAIRNGAEIDFPRTQ